LAVIKKSLTKSNSYFTNWTFSTINKRNKFGKTIINQFQMLRKIIYLLPIIFWSNGYTQISTQRVPISETYSYNGKFKLKSISFDDEFPNTKGESQVSYTQKYESLGVKKKFYKINRSFDLYDGYPFFAAISNDGKKIIYIKDKVYYDGKENQNVTYYINGELKKVFNTDEFINCDSDKEKCDMFYNNQYKVYERTTPTLKKYKKDITEKDKFLRHNFVFNNNDTIYVIDSRKKITLFDLNKGEILKTKIDFDSIYPTIKRIEAVKSNIDYYDYPYKYVIDIENSISKEKLSKSISKLSNLKFISIGDSTFHKYKLFRIDLTGYLDRNGTFEIEKLKLDENFNKEKIKDYLLNTKFKTDFIPRQVDKIYVDNFFGGYRSFNDSIAQQETLKEKERRVKEYKKRLTLSEIDGIFIPKNLYECMVELDKKLNFENKKQLREAKNSWEFNSHMGGLGMWIRNNWGINGGSRLLKYFYDRDFGNEMFGRDEISGLIIDHYIKWLKGNRKEWEKWERKNPIKNK
jgi:hypothetical protein